MDRRHTGKGVLLGVAVAAPAILLASCGGSSSGSGTTSTSGSSSDGARVATRTSGQVTYLTDATGRSLYLFESDHDKASTCNGPCLSAWPPLLSRGRPAATGSARDGMLGTITRSDGSLQVTYSGHPLYYYSGDAKAGETNGEGLDGFGAEWYLVSPGGANVEHVTGATDSSGGSGGSGSSGGSGRSGAYGGGGY